jgi:hypothetical protein
VRLLGPFNTGTTGRVLPGLHLDQGPPRCLASRRLACRLLGACHSYLLGFLVDPRYLSGGSYLRLVTPSPGPSLLSQATPGFSCFEYLKSFEIKQ